MVWPWRREWGESEVGRDHISVHKSLKKVHLCIHKLLQQGYFKYPRGYQYGIPTEPTLNTVCPKIWVNYIILPKSEEQNIQEMETSCCSRFVMLASDALNCACSTQLQKFPKLNDKVLGASFGVSHLTCKENRHRLVGKDLFFCHGKNGCNNKCRAAWCAFACRYCWEEALLEIRRIQMLKRGLCELVKA